MSTEPFPGLRPFRRDEADIFFGRENVIDEMVARLDAYRFLAVTGTSGSGKSSLVFTGLLDALELGLLASAGSDWTIAQCRPGNRPLRALAESLIKSTEIERFDRDSLLLEAALSRGTAGLFQWLDEVDLAPGNNLLLLVDQFEELFRYRAVEIADTAAADVDEAYRRQAWEEAASAFVDVLVGAAAATGRRIYVVATMRSDYLGECAQFAGLAEAINRGQFLTPRLSREQLAEAVAEPVAVCGGTIEPALVNRVLNEMGNDPDQLPLMQHAMMRMWRRAKEEQTGDVHLTEADYVAWIGGLKVALSAHATEVLQSLSKDDQALAETLFRNLTEGSTVADARRHPITLETAAEVAGVKPEQLKPVIEAFRAPGCDFLTPATDELKPEVTIDISHESLIRQWDKLREWMSEEFTSAALWRRLSSSAADWENDPAKMSPWVAQELDNALAWRDRQVPNEAWVRRYGGNLPQAFRFLEAGQKEVRKRRLARIVTSPFAFGVVALIIVLAVVAGISAVQARKAEQTAEADKKKLQEKQQALVALSAQLRVHGRVRAAQSEDLDLARQLALQAVNMVPGDETSPGHKQLMSVLRDAYSNDYNARLLVGSDDAKLFVLDAHGTRAAAVAGDGVALWNVATGLPGPRLLTGGAAPTALAISSDGAFLVTAQDLIGVWNTSAGEEVTHFARTGREISQLAVSLDGKRVLSLDKDGAAEVWDAAAAARTATVVCPPVSGGNPPDTGNEPGHVALRDDGKAGLVAWPDGRVALWTEGRAAPICRIKNRPASFVLFDGDDPVVIWDQPESLADPPPAEFSGVSIIGKLGTPINFTTWTDSKTPAGGHWVFQALAADGGTALARDSSSTQKAPVYAFVPCTDCAYSNIMRGDVRAVARSLKPSRTAVASGNTVIVLGEEPSKLVFPDDIRRIAISPDGTVVAAIGDDAGWVWRIGEPKWRQLADLRAPRSVAFSPDGALLVTADGSSQHAIMVWDFKAKMAASTPGIGQMLIPAATLIGHKADVRQALFLDTNHLISVSDDRTVRFWTAGQQTGSKEQQAPAANSGDQNKVAVDSTPSQWSLDREKTIDIPIETGTLVSIALDTHKNRAAILGTSGHAYMVDADPKSTGASGYRDIWPNGKLFQAIEFTPDGSRLAAVVRGRDDGGEAHLVGDLLIVPLLAPGAAVESIDGQNQQASPYRGGIVFDDDTNVMLATAEGLLRADIDRPPKLQTVPKITDPELTELSRLLIANQRSADELDQILVGEEAAATLGRPRAGTPCSSNLDPCLKAVQNQPDDLSGWQKLAALRQDSAFPPSLAALVGGIEGDADLARQFAQRLLVARSLGSPLAHWFLLGAIRSDRPISIGLVGDLLASGPLTSAQVDGLKAVFRARAAIGDRGADVALALLALQGSPTTEDKKLALKYLLLAERLMPDQPLDLPWATLRANLVRSLTPQEVIDATRTPPPVVAGDVALIQSAPAWNPNLSEMNLRTEAGQLRLFEMAFQRLREKWPADPRQDLLEAEIRLEFATNLFGSANNDDQTLKTAREALAKALGQLAHGTAPLTQVKTEADLLVGGAEPKPLRWLDLAGLGQQFEATAPELAARAYAYIVRVAGEAATDEQKVSSDLISAFKESQHRLVGLIAKGVRDNAVVDELAPETWRWWTVGRKMLRDDKMVADAAALFADSATLLQFLVEARPNSADLARYFTDALDWHAAAAIRGGDYERWLLAERIQPIAAAERLASLDSENGQDRMGEAAELFFAHIWRIAANDSDRSLYGTFAADLNVVNLSEVMARVVQIDRDLIDADSADRNPVLFNFLYALGTVRLNKGPAQDCDRLAASPIDPWRTAPGVLRADMSVDAAIAACSKAPVDKADQPRFNFQLGRALDEKSFLDQANAASWRQKSRDAFVKAVTANYVPAFNEVGIAAYEEGSKDKEYKQVLVALYARYLAAAARPIVGMMIADGSVRDHPAAARFLLEQAVWAGDIESELSLSELISNGTLQSNAPLEQVIHLLIALRLGSPDVHKRAQAIWDQTKQRLSPDEQSQVELEANHFSVDALPAFPDGMLKAFLSHEGASATDN